MTGAAVAGQIVKDAGIVTVMLTACVAVCCGLTLPSGTPESFTCTVNVVVAAISGVPVICPEGDKLKPVGKLLPAASDQVYGATPPVAPNVAEYGTFTAPPDMVVVVMASGAD